MKILISVMDVREVEEAVEGGADIIDVKNPKEGSLGANFPWIIKRIRELTPDEIETSAAIGDMPNLPGTASLAALGAVSSGVDYVKVGLRGVKQEDESTYLMKQVVRAVEDYNGSVPVVATGYGDAERIGSVSPLSIPNVAKEAGAEIAMLDTGVKDGKRLLDFLSTKELRRFVNSAHELGLLAALAGSLKAEDVSKIAELDADIAGFRGAACSNNDRRKGFVTKERVSQLVNAAKV